MMNAGFGIGGFGMGFGLLFGVIVLAALYYVLTDGRKLQSASNTALELLKQRYARGEIDSEEYRMIQQDF